MGTSKERRCWLCVLRLARGGSRPKKSSSSRKGRADLDDRSEHSLDHIIKAKALRAITVVIDTADTVVAATFLSRAIAPSRPRSTHHQRASSRPRQPEQRLPSMQALTTMVGVTSTATATDLAESH